MDTPTQTMQRIDRVDSLRGFALAGILIAHMLEQFIAAPRAPATWEVTSNLADNIIMGFNFIFIGGKFFSIFSLLFGISFAIMMKRAEQRGVNFSGTFVWRLILLMVFGIVHSLIYRGDILSVYALLGLLLPLFYSVPNRWLLIIAALLFAGFGRFAFFSISGTSSLLAYPLTPEEPTIIHYIETLKNGSFTDVAHINFTHGFASKYDFQFSVFGRGYVTFAYFLVGLCLVRIDFFRRLEEFKSRIKKTLYISIAGVVLSVGLMFGNFALLPKPLNTESWGYVFGINFYDWANISMTSVIVCGFLLVSLGRGNKSLLALAPYGRMALSFYLLQSIVGTFLLYGWGLGYLAKLHDWQTLLIAISLISLQIIIAKYWLNRFYFGPLEWLWRCGTYFKIVKMRRE